MPTDDEMRLERVRKLIDSGAAVTKTGQEQINFRTLDELKQIEADLVARTTGRKRKRVFHIRGGKGF